jgi:hypothetical protein
MEANKKLIYEGLKKSEDIYYPERDSGTVIYDATFDLKVIVDTSDGFTSITFRGTVGNFNWLTNLYTLGVLTKDQSLQQIFPKIITEVLYDATCHQGFTRAVEAVYEKIRHQVLLLKQPIRCYGHSLGAGLAQLLAYLLALDKSVPFQIDAVVTFGSPRVFYLGDNPMVKEIYNKVVPNCIRISNQNDIVSFVPFNESFKEKTITSNDIMTLVNIRAWISTSIKTSTIVLSNLFLGSITHFTHVGTGFILAEDGTITELGLDDKGRDFSDISASYLLNYIRYFSVNNIAKTLGISSTAGLVLTNLEQVITSQDFLDTVRRYFQMNSIGYDYIRGTLNKDPLYLRLIQKYGGEEQIRNQLGLLQWRRSERRFYQKGLLSSKGGLYRQYSRYLKTILNRDKDFKRKSDAEKLKILDKTFTDWLKFDNIIIGKTDEEMAKFESFIRRKFLAKLVAIRKRVGSDQIVNFWVSVGLSSLIISSIFLYFFYEAGYVGTLAHQTRAYKEALDLAFGDLLEKGLAKKGLAKKGLAKKGVEGEMPEILDRRVGKLRKPLGFIYTTSDNIGDLVVF